MRDPKNILDRARKEEKLLAESGMTGEELGFLG